MIPTSPPTSQQETEREREIVHAYLKEGLSINAIIQRFNLTGAPAVYAILRRANLPRPAEEADAPPAEPEANGSRPDPVSEADKLDQGIKADYEANFTIHEIRARHGIGYARVRETIDRLGLQRPPLRPVGQPPDPTPPKPVALPLEEREAKIVRDYQAGRNTGDIQRELSISPGQLYRTLRKHGVEPRRADRAEVGEQPADAPTIEPTPEALAEMPEVEMSGARRGHYAQEQEQEQEEEVEPAPMTMTTVTETETPAVAQTEALPMDFSPEEPGPDDVAVIETRARPRPAPAGLKLYRATRIVRETIELAASDFLSAAKLAQADNAELVALELQES